MTRLLLALTLIAPLALPRSAEACLIGRAGTSYTYSPLQVDPASATTPVVTLGFENLPSWVTDAPASIFVGSIDASGATCAAVYLTETTPTRLVCELATPLAPDRAFRITGAELTRPGTGQSVSCVPNASTASDFAWIEGSVAVEPASGYSVPIGSPVLVEIATSSTSALDTSWSTAVTFTSGGTPYNCPVTQVTAEPGWLHVTCTAPSNLPRGTVTVDATFTKGPQVVTATPATWTAKSTSSRLTSLSLSSGSLSPGFSPATTTYANASNYANTVTSITVSTGVAAGSTITINGTPVTVPAGSLAIPLPTTSTPVSIVVTAELGGSTTYTLTLNRLGTTTSTLSALAVTGATLSPTFVSTTQAYTTSVPAGTTSVPVVATRTLGRGTFTIAGQPGTDGVAVDVPLPTPSTAIPVVVTPDTGSPRTYTITVTRPAFTNADLTSLTMSPGSFSPGFAPGTTSYTASVPFSTTSVGVSTVRSDSRASVQINGVTVTDGATRSVPLSVGSNFVTILVSSEAGAATRTYSLVVTRSPASTISTLSGLTVAGSTLSPSFSSGTTSYSTSVAGATAQITATLTFGAASLTIGGVASTSGVARSVPLGTGTTTVPIVVTAEGGTPTTTYTLSITRTPGSVSTLAALTTSGGALAPTFASGTTSYAVSVPFLVSSVTLTGTRTSAQSTFTINGQAASDGVGVSAPLPSTTTAVPIVVTAESGTTTTYTVTYTRVSNTNSLLSALGVVGGTLSPAFSPGAASYTVSVPAGTTSAQITATRGSPLASLTIGGQPAADATPVSVSLPGPSTSVPVVVTAESGVTTTYTVTVTRPAATNANLATLEVLGNTLSPAFAPTTTNYSVTLDAGETSVLVKASRANGSATLTINGAAAADGAEVSVPVSGSTTVTIVVTAESGASQTYTLAVQRPPSSDASLGALTVGQAALSPPFSPTIHAYLGTLASPTVTTVDVSAVRSSAGASVSINGAATVEGVPMTVSLATTSTITVQVTAESGAQSAYVVQLALPGVRVSHTGYLLDGADAPVRGVRTMAFSIHDVPSGGTAVWTSGNCAVDVKDGYYAVDLGSTCGTAIATTALPAGASRWLQVTTGGVALEPRQRFGELPAASDSARFAGLPVSSFVRYAGSNRLPAADASQLSVATASANGVMSASDKAKLDGLSSNTITGAGPIAVTGTGTRTISLIGAVPTSNGGTGLLTGPTAAGQFLRSSGAGAWAVGTLDAADVPDLGATYLTTAGDQSVSGNKTFAGTTTFSGAAIANAGLKLGNDSNACTAGKAGTLRWTGSALELCNGTIWGAMTMAFTPQAVTGLKLWVRADLGITQTGGLVSRWADQSGNGNDFVQATGSRQPTLVASSIGGRPGLRTVAASAQSMNSTISVGVPYTVAIVARMSGATRMRILSGISNNWLIGWWGGFEDQLFAQGWVNNPSTATSTSPRIYLATSDGAASTLWRNGTFVVSNSGGVAAPVGLQFPADLEPSDADVAEIIVVNRVLATTERQQLELYLNARYGVY